MYTKLKPQTHLSPIAYGYIYNGLDIFINIESGREGSFVAKGVIHSVLFYYLDS